MMLFVAGSGVLLFGLRAVPRFDAVWAMVILSMPLTYHMAVISLGGGKTAAGVATLLITGAATLIAAGADDLRVTAAAIAGWGAGLLTLIAVVVLRPDASLLAFQQGPSMVSIVCVSWVLIVLRGRRPWGAGPGIDPLTGRDVWWGALLVAAVGITVAAIPLPAGAHPPVLPRYDGAAAGAPAAVPLGWHEVATKSYDVVRRLYGSDATLDRQTVVADFGNPAWDKFGRPRTVVVDTITTRWPMSLYVFPPTVLFAVNERLSERRPVDLGHGVTGELLTAVDDDLLLTWTVLEFQWGDEDAAQRVLIGSVDNHEADAPFPEPNGAVLKTLNRLVTILFRGSAVVYDETSSFADAGMLTEFGRGLVDTRMRAARRGIR
ncbi:hypothetical protein ACQI4F_11350 [Mycolicibacterium vaccae]|uniref:hypothetical protein n=1 Tax=Mycolicibacterium vaccae TaxID=1810 RepID=UPI003CF75047